MTVGLTRLCGLLMLLSFGGCACSRIGSVNGSPPKAEAAMKNVATKTSIVTVETTYGHIGKAETEFHVEENGDVIKTSTYTPVLTGEINRVEIEKYLLNGKEITKEEFERAK